MTPACLHCAIRPRMNGVGSLCEFCWLNVPNSRNSERCRWADCACRMTQPNRVMIHG